MCADAAVQGVDGLLNDQLVRVPDSLLILFPDSLLSLFVAGAIDIELESGVVSIFTVTLLLSVAWSFILLVLLSGFRFIVEVCRREQKI